MSGDVENPKLLNAFGPPERKKRFHSHLLRLGPTNGGRNEVSKGFINAEAMTRVKNN
jgi:hypothetical protein